MRSMGSTRARVGMVRSAGSQGGSGALGRAALLALAGLIALTGLLGGAGAVAAQAAPAAGGEMIPAPPPTLQEQAAFCRGTYALCISAECVPEPTLDRLNNYYVTHALCECDVIQDSAEAPAWSMGPGACEDRGPVTQNGRTFLISTYSNLYNDTNQEVECGEDTTWAWCYGAPCVVDEADPSKALCNCPLTKGRADLLVGDCSGQDYCSQIWSAAVPAGDCFANHYYSKWMTDHGYPSNKPATLCKNGQTICQPECVEGRGVVGHEVGRLRAPWVGLPGRRVWRR